MCLRDNKRGANTEAEPLEEAGGLPVEAARKGTVFHIHPLTNSRQVRKFLGTVGLYSLWIPEFAKLKR